MIKYVSLLLYYSFAKYLPSSFYPGGNFFNKIRIRLLKNIFPIGINCKIQNNVHFGKGTDIEIGNNCQINSNVQLNNVKINDYVMIAPGVTILGRMHDFSTKNIPMILQGERIVKQTVIEKDVWIGTNVIIMPGIKLAKGCIIGAGGVVTKDTQPYGIYGGIPAKLIKMRN